MCHFQAEILRTTIEVTLSLPIVEVISEACDKMKFISAWDSESPKSRGPR